MWLIDFFASVLAWSSNILNKNKGWWKADREVADWLRYLWGERNKDCGRAVITQFHRSAGWIKYPHRIFSGVGAGSCLYLLWNLVLLWLSFYHRYFSLQATHPLGFDDIVRLEIESNICREGGPLPNCFTTPLRQAWTTMEKVTKTPKLLSYKKFLLVEPSKCTMGKTKCNRTVENWNSAT